MPRRRLTRDTLDIGKQLQHLDSKYHHKNHRPLGWVFCDLLDYYYGMSARQLFRERRSHSGLISLPVLATALAAMKFTNTRVKWDWKKAVRHRRIPLAPTEEDHDESVLDREAELIRAYGKTSWELAEEAERGYDIKNIRSPRGDSNTRSTPLQGGT